MAKSTSSGAVAPPPSAPEAAAPLDGAALPPGSVVTTEGPALQPPEWPTRDNLGRAYDAPDLPPGFGDRVLHACLSPALGELRAFDEESIRTRARNAAALVIGADQLVREYLEGRLPDYLRR